jgi:hypothetical protein
MFRNRARGTPVIFVSEAIASSRISCSGRFDSRAAAGPPAQPVRTEARTG